MSPHRSFFNTFYSFHPMLTARIHAVSMCLIVEEYFSLSRHYPALVISKVVVPFALA